MVKTKALSATLLALAPFVFHNAPAMALDGLYLGVGLQDATADLQYEYLNSVGTEYGSGTGFNLFAGYKLTENMALELEGRYWGIELDTTGNADGDLRGNVSTGFRFFIPVADSIDLTAGFGLTHWFIKDFDDEDGREADITTRDMAGYYGLGIASHLSDVLEVGFRYENHGVFVNQAESFTLYAAYYFGGMRRSAPQDVLSRLYVSVNAAQFSRGGYAESVNAGVLGGSVGNDVSIYLSQIPSYEGNYNYGGGDDTDGYYVFLGYQMNPWVALELGLVDFGNYEFTLGTLRDSNGVDYLINEKLIDADTSGTLFGFKGALYRASYGLNIFTRLGVASVETDIKRSYLSFNSPGQVSTRFIAPYYGVGISYQVLDSLSVSLDYLVFELDDIAVNARSRSLGLGIAFAFGEVSRSARNVRETSSFTDYFNGDDQPATNSLERTTACGERYRDMFFGCDDNSERE